MMPASNELTERQRKFVSAPRIGRLASTMPDGSPHIAPIWYRFEDGAFLVLTDRASRKHRNVERDPRVVLCIDEEKPPYHTVIVRGTVEVAVSPGREWREALAVHYLGEEAGRAYTAANDSPNNVLLRIVPERISGW
jgi:PPOX class probable F420-dependent enzyme